MRALPPINECPSPHQILPMNIIFWNCRGALSPKFYQSVDNIIRAHSPSILVITETRVGRARAKAITDRLPFDGAAYADIVGYAGGIWLLWVTDAVDITILSSTEQEIHASVKVCQSSLSWIISAVYASPRFREHHLLWKNLCEVAALHSMPWIIFGDFNECLSSEDKLGGQPVSMFRTQRFKECLDSCNMIDLGFHGPKFTWTNKRELTHLIQIRLDRCFANQSWRTCYLEASVQHLSRLHSDHCSVLLSLQHPTPRIRVRPFPCQPMWLSHPDFSRVVEDAWSILNPLHDNIDSFTLAAS